MFVKLFSWPMLITGILSLGFFLFFLLFSHGLGKAGKDTKSFFIFALVVLTTAIYSLSFFLFMNFDKNKLLLNIFNRLAVISSMYVITFFIHFVSVFYTGRMGKSLKIFHSINILFTILTVIPNPLFLDAGIYFTSIYYHGLVRGVLFYIWGVYFTLMMGYACAILWINYSEVKKEKDKAQSSYMLFLSSIFWICFGIIDSFTAMGIFDLPPLSWIGALLMVVSISRLHMNDIRMLFLRSQYLYEEVIHDKMTGAFSRGFIFVELENALKRVKRNLNDQIYIVMIDIDFFKNINDKFGHLCGDEVIKHVVAMAEKSIRSHDLVARIGGDEFLILIHEPITIMNMQKVVKRVHAFITESPVIYKGNRVEVGVSIGVSATISADIRSSLSPEVLYACADQALYQAKESGRNRSVFSKSLIDIP